MKAPDKRLLKLRFFSDDYLEGFDGRTAWQKSEDGVDLPLGEEFEEKQREADFYSGLHFRQLHRNLKYVGKELFDGEDAHILESTMSKLIKERLAFSVKSGLLIGVATERETDGKKEVGTMLYGDYRPVKGVLRAFSLKYKSRTEEWSATAKRVLVNVEINDAIFKKPEE
jgi:hypothetical protein